jgi:hypothetical protein
VTRQALDVLRSEARELERSRLSPNKGGADRATLI